MVGTKIPHMNSQSFEFLRAMLADHVGSATSAKATGGIHEYCYPRHEVYHRR